MLKRLVILKKVNVMQEGQRTGSGVIRYSSTSEENFKKQLFQLFVI